MKKYNVLSILYLFVYIGMSHTLDQFIRQRLLEAQKSFSFRESQIAWSLNMISYVAVALFGLFLFQWLINSKQARPNPFINTLYLLTGVLILSIQLLSSSFELPIWIGLNIVRKMESLSLMAGSMVVGISIMSFIKLFRELRSTTQ